MIYFLKVFGELEKLGSKDANCTSTSKTLHSEMRKTGKILRKFYKREKEEERKREREKERERERK